jgi:hypothetical protein
VAGRFGASGVGERCSVGTVQGDRGHQLLSGQRRRRSIVVGDKVELGLITANTTCHKYDSDSAIL